MDTRLISATLNGGQTWSSIPGPPAPAIQVANRESLIYRYDERDTNKELYPYSWKDVIGRVQRIDNVSTVWTMNPIQKEFFYEMHVNFPDIFARLGKSWVAINVKVDVDSDPDAFLDTEGWEFAVDLSQVCKEVTSVTAVFMGDTARGTYVQKLVGRVLQGLTKDVKIIIKVKASIDLESILTQSGLVASLTLMLYTHRFGFMRSRLEGPLQRQEPELG